MGFKIDCQKHEQALCFEVVGEINNHLDSIARYISAKAAYREGVVIDIRGATRRPSVEKVFIHVLKYPTTCLRKIALVDLRQNWPLCALYARLVQRRGYQTCSFSDVEAARDWLLTDRVASKLDPGACYQRSTSGWSRRQTFFFISRASQRNDNSPLARCIRLLFFPRGQVYPIWRLIRPHGSLLRMAVFCFILASFAQPAFAQSTRDEVIPAGTLLHCTMSEPNFSSKTANVGDPVLCHLAPVVAFGRSIFPRGAELSGHLQDYKNPGHFVGKGWMQIDFDRIVLPGAQILPVSAKVIYVPHMKVDKQGEVHGKGHPKRDAVEWMIPVLWPVKVLTIPARGPYPTFKGETRIALRLMEDIEVPLSVSRNTVPMPPWATPSSYNIYGYSGSLRRLPSSASHAITVDPTYAEPSEPVLSSSSIQLTIIALKGGAAFLAREYWIQDSQVHCISSTGEEKLLPLERIDLNQTTRVNEERNVKFILQSRDILGEE